MRTFAAIVIATSLHGCGGGVLDSEVDPTLTDSVNPQVNPVVDLDIPISILGLGGGAGTTSSASDASSSERSGEL